MGFVRVFVNFSYEVSFLEFGYLMSESIPTDVVDTTAHVQKLFVQHQQILISYILSMEPNYSDATDILQEVFLAVSKKAESWNEGTSFVAWVSGFARIEVLRFQRKRGKQLQRLGPEALEKVFADVDDSQEQFRERLNLLENCLQKLPPRSQELIRFRYQEGYLPEKIAPLMGWTVNAVRVGLSRARQSLRECVARGAQHDRTN